ncbi:MAG TPA: hypothetical protein VGS12_14145 [Caulobacteraceae bacterium]|nr:hypothetical protein [Caulobacteraceae bacterium]
MSGPQTAALIVMCGKLVCPYHNVDFGYAVAFPKIYGTTICVPLYSGGLHGVRMLFEKTPDCQLAEQRSINVSGDVDALGWGTAEKAASAICAGERITRTAVRIQGHEVVRCESFRRAKGGWISISYIAIRPGNVQNPDIILTVNARTRPSDERQMDRLAMRVVGSIELPPLPIWPKPTN